MNRTPSRLESTLRVLLLALCACALYLPGSRAVAQSGVQTAPSPQIQTLGDGWSYAFLLPPFLIRTSWVFAPTDGPMLLAATPAALTAKLGGEVASSRPGSERDVLPLYARIGALGWELVACSPDDQDAAPGMGGPGCVFKRKC